MEKENGVPAGPNLAEDPFGVCFPDAIKKWAQFVIVIIAKKPPCRKAFPLVFRGIFYFNSMGDFFQEWGRQQYEHKMLCFFRGKGKKMEKGKENG